MIDKYFTEDKLIYHLCRVRARYAKQRSKKQLLHTLSNKSTLNHHKDEKTPDEVQLMKILPPRNKWKKLGKTHRYKNIYQKLNSIEYNARSILKTIKYFKKHKPQEPFIIELNSFITNIQYCINNDYYKIEKPEIYPKLKEKKDSTGKKLNICRPISLFALEDKIIISQTNKYLSEIFDEEFYCKSYAFRSPIKGKDLITHHNCIEDILNYKEKYFGKSLWVAECDMSKFYDSVSHSIIKLHFDKLVKKVEEKGKNVDKRAVKIFNDFLDSYNFVEDVLPKNEDSEYWKKYKIINGEFGWVKKELINLKHYSKIENDKIGIPQGGALSGLIANMVLDYADSMVISKKDDTLLYIRFCDDMILIHPNHETCNEIVNQYYSALLDLKLVPHQFKDNLKNDSNSFWKTKSKSPYEWSAEHKKDHTFPWIGFVGYEIHFNGYVRVRKSSLKKELSKQKEVVQNIKNAIHGGNKRSRNGTIIESAINRLTGMSVGRIHMWNYNTVAADMCWVHGFKKLNKNTYLQKQLKQLDKNRNHQMARLKKEVSQYIDPPLDNNDQDINRPYYGKAYSYYFQTLKGK